MNGLISRLTSGMDAGTAAQYGKLFSRVYPATNRPPVITLDDIPYQLNYIENKRVFKPSTHIGQRKLFDNELKFITENIPNVIEPRDITHRVYVVYAGAAPSNHTGLLSDLVNGGDINDGNVEIVFILVDPNAFDIFDKKPVYLWKKSDSAITPDSAEIMLKRAVDGNERIYIINDLFTPMLAHAIVKIIGNVYFISDIRTNISDGRRNPDSLDILWNLSQQYNWMNIMKPVMSMLKFRHPFYVEDPEVFNELSKQSPYKDDFDISKQLGIDFVENFKTKKLVYWNGIVDLQPFPGLSSTETRLVTPARELNDWGTPEVYENKLFYYNNIERCYGHHINENADKKLGFDHCNDCAIENYIWKKYVAKYPNTAKRMGPDITDLVAKLSKNTRRSLLRDNHGIRFGFFPTNELYTMIETHFNNPTSKPQFSAIRNKKY